MEEAILRLHEALLQAAAAAAAAGQDADSEDTRAEGRDAAEAGVAALGCAPAPAPSSAAGTGATGASVRQQAPTAAATVRGAAARVAAALRGAVVAEWWAHTRDPAAAHQLHFDINEDVLRQVLRRVTAGVARVGHGRGRRRRAERGGLFGRG